MDNYLALVNGHVVWVICSVISFFLATKGGISPPGSLWEVRVPQRTAAFGWMALFRGKIMTVVVETQVDVYTMCLAEAEMMHNVLLNCLTAQLLWRYVQGWFDYSRPIPHSQIHLFEEWKRVWV